MNTPPFSDAAASPSMPLLSLSHQLAHPNHLMPPPAHHPLAGVDGEDVRQLYTTSWRALDTQPPPTVREILAAYRAKGDGDREMLLAMLQAKTAEDQVRPIHWFTDRSSRLTFSSFPPFAYPFLSHVARYMTQFRSAWHHKLHCAGPCSKSLRLQNPNPCPPRLQRIFLIHLMGMDSLSQRKASARG